MQFKNKLNNDSLQSEVPQGPSPLQLRSRPPKNKDSHVRPHKLHKQPTPSIKGKQHLPSRSALEPTEHLHYNSPNLPMASLQTNRSTNAFTFTQLLQHNPPNHPSKQQADLLLDGQYAEVNFSLKPSPDNGQCYSRTPNTIVPFTSHVGSVYNESELTVNDMEFSRILRQKLSNIRSQPSKEQVQVKSKSISKSPLKVTHRLNNTPKVIEKARRQPKEQRESRQPRKTQNQEGQRQPKTTFSQMLSGQLMSESVDIENINLQCSEKIFKFIRESAQKEKKEKENYKKNKSNLLSTGIINLSHPNGEGKEEKEQAYRALDSHNAGHCQPLSPPATNKTHKTEQLKHKLSKFNKALLQNMTLFSQQSFTDEISNNFNPELGQLDANSIIQELTQLNTHFQGYFQAIIHNIERTSQTVYQDIANHIELINTSKSSMIDWIQVQQHLAEKETLEQALCCNEIHLLKVQLIEAELQQEKDKKGNESIEERGNYALHELQAIELQLDQEISALSLPIRIPNKSQAEASHPAQQLLVRLKSQCSALEGLAASFQSFYS